jgi:formamidopyrimidine-DNA glycosylase
MPELPEVETLCRQLHAKIAGKKIRAASVFDEKLQGTGDLRGRIVREVRRSGKTILLLLDDAQTIAIHLRMTGRLFWHASKTKPRHSRWRLSFAAGNVDLVDPRRFATVKIEKSRREQDGPDLLTGFDEKAFLERQARRKISVKVLLMDPKAIAGIGNIYACEILHQAGISPLRQSATLTPGEWKRIFRLARRILKKGIEKRGTSISDWRDLYGCPGENQYDLRAYGQDGKRCRSCGCVIARIKQNGRGTYYCPRCQK